MKRWFVACCCALALALPAAALQVVDDRGVTVDLPRRRSAS